MSKPLTPHEIERLASLERFASQKDHLGEAEEETQRQACPKVRPSDSDTLLKIIHECQDLQDRYDPKTGHWADTVFTPYQAELMKIVLVNLGQLRLAALNAE
mgnify:FL=1